MAQVDPHGWTLTIISVCVVFLALLILFFLYNLSGNIFSGKYSGKKKVHAAKGERMDEVAAAIALALQQENGVPAEAQAAIATALHLYLDEGVHDPEPGFITFSGRKESEWGQKQFNFRKYPKQ